MINTGLVSVTFRKLKVNEIVQLVKKAGLVGIEWGSDVHVPYGNLKCARETYDITVEAGLQIASYGSYYRVGCSASEQVDFENVLETAVTLNAPLIRVWAGDKPSINVDQSYWESVIEDSRRIGSMAQSVGIKIAFEFHSGSLTDSRQTAIKLLHLINHPNVYSYWQPSAEFSQEERVTSLKELEHWLSHIHVFYWKGFTSYPLSEGRGVWEKYFKIIEKMHGDRFCMLEFVKDSSIEQFLKDATVLKQMLKIQV